MKARYMGIVSLLAAGSLFATGTALAKVSQQKADQLGTTLTPVGANPDASEDGLVPKWTPHAIGGPKKGYYPHNDKFMKEKPNVVITADNMDKYKDKLSRGAQYMLKHFSSYKLKVYPSHRTVNYPDKYEAATKKNATTCYLENVDVPVDCNLGFPFPIPTNGAEPMWNHKVKWRGGGQLIRQNDQMIVDPDGHYTETNITEKVEFMYASPKHPDIKFTKDQHRYLNYTSILKSPPRVAGEILLVHESGAKGNAGRQAWLYSPALKRIRRAPNVCCDNPYEGTDGMEFYDQVDMFNGVMDRWNWKLKGKKEMIIPYDNFKIVKAKYKDIAAPNHVNMDLPRYEVHRVWVVEANVKPGKRVTYTKRVFYIDEDSWNIVMIDNYDSKGQLINYQVGMFAPYYNIGGGTTSPEIIYHLDNGRYFVTALQGATPYDLTATFPSGFFNPTSVQRRANR